MACYVPTPLRDLLIRLFREFVYQRVGFVEFQHQAEFRLATEGYHLTEQVIDAPDEPPLTFDPNKIKVSDYPMGPRAIQIMVACEPDHPHAKPMGRHNFVRYEWRMAEPRVFLVRQRDGSELFMEGVIAHQATDMAAFKAGKSKNIGMWLTGFACLPGATIDLVGLQYVTSEHEFSYLTEALLGGTHPIIRKPLHHYADVRNGRMVLETQHNCSYECKSWQNKDTLRGGQITAYSFHECYQLPGLEVWSDNQQNLRVEEGFSAFSTTPDRPWVKALHGMAHGSDPDWHCSCDATAYVNPFSFDLSKFMSSAPDWETIKEFAPELYPLCKKSGLEPKALMSREKFMISWLGKVGGFVGRVYNFKKEALVCNPGTHPEMWTKEVGESWENRQAYLERLRAS